MLIHRDRDNNEKNEPLNGFIIINRHCYDRRFLCVCVLPLLLLLRRLLLLSPSKFQLYSCEYVWSWAHQMLSIYIERFGILPSQTHQIPRKPHWFILHFGLFLLKIKPSLRMRCTNSLKTTRKNLETDWIISQRILWVLAWVIGWVFPEYFHKLEIENSNLGKKSVFFLRRLIFDLFSMILMYLLIFRNQIECIILKKFVGKPAKSIFDYINADNPLIHKTKYLTKPT